MKLLILSALVATSFCWSWRPMPKQDSVYSSHSRYEPGKEYVYEYESQVLTGLPTFSRQYSGLKIVADVKLVFSDPATMQLDNVQVLSLNKEIMDMEHLPPTKQLSRKDFTPLPTNDNRLIADKLQQLIKFNYNNFKITKLMVCTEETNWSINIKRGILGMLQVKLQPDNTDYKITENLPYNDLEKENVTSFDTLEAAIDGTCYSSLHVYPHQEQSSNYRVIKARDTSRCLKLNVVEQTAYPQRQSNCDCRNNMNNMPCSCRPITNLWNSTDLRYDVYKTDYKIQSSDGKNLIIKEACQSIATRIESPHTHHEHVLSVSNQTLVFRQARNQMSALSSQCPSFTNVNEPWKLRVLVNDKLMMTPDQVMKKARDMLTELVDISQDLKRFDDQCVVFFQLMKHLKLCSYTQLNTLLTETKPTYRKWKLYIDALKTSNNTGADALLLNKIMSGDIQNGDAISIFIAWAASKVPTLTILDFMNTKLLPALEKDEDREMVYGHAMLAFGSMVRRYIHSEEMEISRCILPVDKQFHQNNIDSCRKYEKYVEARLSDASTEERKIMVLKAIANLGSIKSLPMLQSLMVDTEPNAVRVHAIWAVKNMGFQNQRKVIQTLVPIMLQRHCESELRIAAFVMLMKCNPTASLLELQKHLNTEPDLEFKTFVVKYMRNMLETEQPECENCNMRVRQVLKSIRAFHFSHKTTDFQMKYGPKTSDEKGDMIRISTVGSKTTPFPQARSIQHFTGQAHQWNHLWEIGYRAEGMESLFARLMQRSPQPSILRQSVRDFSKLMRSSCSGSHCNTKPSLTLYVRVLGQQISFAQIDEQAMGALMMKASRDGKVEIPLTMFETMVTVPRKVRMLQPSGHFMQTLLSHVVLIDLDGKATMDLTPGRLPTFSFKTSKPIRLEVKTEYTHKLDAGFTMTGLSSIVMSRAFVKAGESCIKYDMHRGQLTADFTDASPSTNILANLEWKAETVTVNIPGSLPNFASTKREVCKYLAVDESQKKTIDHTVDFFKSIELDTRISGEVNAPEMYSFVRDRMFLLPTYISIYRQDLKLCMRPQVSSRRTFSLGIYSRFPIPTKHHSADMMRWNGDKKESSESNFLGGLFGWGKSESEESTEQSYEMTTSSAFLRPRSMGSICYGYGAHLASISDSKVLNMTVNVTSTIEHEYPSSTTTFKFVRPAIPSMNEAENFMFIDELTSTVNPSQNQVVQVHKMRWGKQSSLTKKITITNKLTPTYKDQVCHEENSYGCKDGYGVSYPIWYNYSMEITSENTDKVQQLRDMAEPYLINRAESVYMYPSQNPPQSSDDLKLQLIVRPFENKVDYICYDRQFVMNISRVYSPFETKVNNYIANTHYPIGNQAMLYGSDVLSMHHFSGPMNRHRDYCTYKDNMLHTFERKVMMKPITDCEVLLSGDCMENKDFAVSMIPHRDSNLPKMVKVQLSDKLIMMDIKEHNGMKNIEVRVNGEPMRHSKMMSIKDNHGRELAMIECPSMDRCHLYSSPMGLYLNLDKDMVSIEMDAGKVSSVCGMCAMDSKLPIHITHDLSMAIIRQNLIPGSQCTLREAYASPQSSCSKQQKHKVVVETEHGEIMKCVSADRLDTCTDGCMISKKRHFKTVVVYCLKQRDAYEIGMRPMMEGSDLIAEVDSTIMQKMMKMGSRKNMKVAVYDQCL